MEPRLYLGDMRTPDEIDDNQQRAAFVPWAYFPLMRQAGLTLGEIAIVIAALTKVDVPKSGEFKKGAKVTFKLSQQALAELVGGCSEDTIQRAFDKLKASGLATLAKKHNRLTHEAAIWDVTVLVASRWLGAPEIKAPAPKPVAPKKSTPKKPKTLEPTVAVSQPREDTTMTVPTEPTYTPTPDQARRRKLIDALAAAVRDDVVQEVVDIIDSTVPVETRSQLVGLDDNIRSNLVDSGRIGMGYSRLSIASRSAWSTALEVSDELANTVDHLFEPALIAQRDAA